MPQTDNQGSNLRQENLQRPPIRVLLWSVQGSGLHYAGAGSSAYRLYAADNGVRFRVSLAFANPDQVSGGHYEAEHQLKPYPTSPLSLTRFLRSSRQWLSDHIGDFDVFHGLTAFQHTVSPAYFAYKQGLPSVVKVANAHSDLANKSGIKSILGLPRRRRNAISQIDAVIAISKSIQKELLGYGIAESKIALIPNGVNTQVFKPCNSASEQRQLRDQFGWPDRPTILFVGGINQRKRPHLIAEAMVRLGHVGRDLQLVLAGPIDDRPYFDQINSLMQYHGLTGGLIHFPFTPDIAPIYRAADVFCLPSSNEGMPNALLEAMASGLPCVGTDTSGINDLIKDKVTGRLSTPEADAIAQAFQDLILNADHATQLGAAARDMIDHTYSSCAVLDQHQQLFLKIAR